MNSVIITVAGTATRFNKDTSSPTLKCLYWEGNPKQTLLYEIMKKSSLEDYFVVVGGYLYESLKQYISTYCSEFFDRIILVYNELFDIFGSGYSLIKGIENLPETTNSVTFVEGDLHFDKLSYQKVQSSFTDVITINRDSIEASKAVAVVIDEGGHPHYIYDTKHSTLRFEKPFKAIYNSAQIWRFVDMKRLRKIVKELSQSQIEGTNLEIIEGYFTPMSVEQIKFIHFEAWCNCNTVADYRTIYTI